MKTSKRNERTNENVDTSKRDERKMRYGGKNHAACTTGIKAWCSKIGAIFFLRVQENFRTIEKERKRLLVRSHCIVSRILAINWPIIFHAIFERDLRIFKRRIRASSSFGSRVEFQVSWNLKIRRTRHSSLSNLWNSIFSAECKNHGEYLAPLVECLRE